MEPAPIAADRLTVRRAAFINAMLQDVERKLFMTQTVSVDEGQNNLQDLLAQALAGNEVIITDRGKPVARLVPIAPSKKKRVAGLNRGTIWTSEDFDEPLPDELWLGQE